MRGAPAHGPGRSLGYVIPRLLVAACLLDVAFRFVSIEPFTFRAWETLRRYHPSGVAFEPNRRYSNERSYGDLTAIGNLPALRQYRAEVFTTDTLGFRNAAQILKGPVDAILVGDSFAVGAGVKDDQTLPSRLSEPRSCGVYNAAGPGGGPDRIQAVARSPNMRNRLVIHLYSEASEDPAIPTWRETTLKRFATEEPTEVRAVNAWLRGLVTVSPLQVLSERALKALANDRMLPNGYASNVVAGAPPKGDPRQFLGTGGANGAAAPAGRARA